MTQENRYVPGKVDYYGNGRANCEAEITWSLTDDGRFSMSAGIWQSNKRDLEMCGQYVDTVAAYFPNDTLVQRMLAVWQRYHLNDMRAGSAVQETYLREHPIPEADYRYPKSHYVVASKVLADAGLNPDADGYLYGHEWKREELPAEVQAEIASWQQATANK